MLGQILRNVFAGKYHRHKGLYLDLLELNELLATKEDANHDHDDTYYTETETDALLAGKADQPHDHDDTYYTESETDALLAGKSNTGHNHDGRYYTETELNNGQLDNRYYTESEIDALLAGLPSAIVPAFKATKTTQVINTGWHLVTWNALAWNLNSPNFSTIAYAHLPTNASLLGLWHYDLRLQLTTTNTLIARVVHQDAGVIAQSIVATNGSVILSFDYPWTVANKTLHIEATSSGAFSLSSDPTICHWSGHRVGPLS